MAQFPIERLQQAIEHIISGQPQQREESKGVLQLARDKAVPALLQAFKTTRSGRVARVLAGLGARQALPLLRQFAADSNIDLSERAHIVLALAELLDGRDAFDEATGQTLDLLQRDASHVIRALVVYAWEQIGGTGAKQAIAKLCNDPHAWVRRRAHFALARYAIAADASAEQEALCLQVQTLLLQAERHQIGNKDIALQLQQLGHQAAPILAHFLPHCCLATRLQIIDVLGRFGHPQAAAALLMLAVEASSKSREGMQETAASLRALVNCLTGQETGMLKQLLLLAKRQNTHVRAAALLCMGRLMNKQKGTASMKIVVANLLHPDKQVQQAAAVALSEGFRSWHQPLLNDLLQIYEQPPSSVVAREAILIALSRVLLSDDARGHRALQQALLQELQTNNRNCRLLSLVLLTRLYTPNRQLKINDARRIAARLTDASADVRINAAKLLLCSMPAGMSGLVPTVRHAISQAQPAELALLLRLLHRTATAQAKQVLQQVALLDNVATKQLAAKLLADWPAATTAKTGDDQQPTQVVVEARFDEEE
ncbi:MAG: hypothetical protein AAF310_00970 [Myxococcota bacterium]